MNVEQCKLCACERKKCPLYNLVSSDKILCDKYVIPRNNSKGMFRQLFTWKGRISRKEYLLTLLLFFVSFYCILYLPEGLSLVAMVFLVYILICQFIKRVHDFGKTGLDYIMDITELGFSPFTMESDPVNKFGSDPTESYEKQVFKVQKEHMSN